MSKPNKIEELFKSLKDFESVVNPSLWEGIKANIQPAPSAVSSGSSGTWLSGLSMTKLIIGMAAIAVFSVVAYYLLDTPDRVATPPSQTPEIATKTIPEKSGIAPERNTVGASNSKNQTFVSLENQTKSKHTGNRVQTESEQTVQAKKNSPTSRKEEEPVVQEPLPTSETRIDNRKILTQTFQLGERTFQEVPVSRINAFPVGGPAPLEVKFIAEGLFDEIHWNFGDGDAVEGVENPEHTFADPGFYEVTVAGNLTGGLYFSEKVFIEVRSGEKAGESSALSVPNVFTPNGDGEYDQFQVHSSGIERFTIAIYNRGGRLVFQSNSSDFLWDGRDMDGQPIPDGTYYYMITATGIDGKLYAPKGSLTVLR